MPEGVTAKPPSDGSDSSSREHKEVVYGDVDLKQYFTSSNKRANKSYLVAVSF